VATVSSTVELLIKAQQPQRALRALSQSTDKLKKGIDATQGAFNRVGQAGTTSATRAGAAYKNLGTEVSGVNKIVRTLRNSFVALGGAVTASGILQAGTDAIEAERRIKLLSASSGQTAEALEIASRAASQFGLSSTEANTGVARLLARLSPMGVSLEDIESTFAGFNIAAKLAGATASESSGAFLQLTQALGSGVLRGQELNSILEQAPLIATAIALEMNTTTGSLKKLGEEGKITSQIVLAALKRVETEGAEKLEEAMRGPAQQFKNLRNAGVELSKVIAENLLPAIIPLVQGATNLLKSFNELPKSVQTFIIATTLATGAVVALNKAIAIFVASKLGGFFAQQIALLKVFGAKIYIAAAAAGALKIAMAALPFGAVALGVGLLTTALINQNRKQKEFNELIKFGGEEALKAAIKVEELRKAQAQQQIDEAGPTGRMGKNSPFQRRMRRIIKDADDRIAKLEKRAGEIKVPTPLEPKIDDKRSDISQKLLDLNNQLRAAQEGEQARLAATLELMVAKQKISEANLLPLEKEDRLNQAHFEFRQKIKGIDEEIAQKRADDFEAQIKHQDELRKKIAEQKHAYEELNTTFRNGIVDGILAAVEGTKSLSDSLLGVIKQMARLILQQQLLNALSGFNLFGGGGGGFAPSVATSGTNFFGGGFSPIDFFANGGRPPVGRPSVVGERGPELFVPDRAGTIVPNGGFGGANVVVNVDASGSSVQGDEGSSRQLGALIGAAVQGEIIKQQRPGGLLSR
jgi:tape measure domain-containing protein